jgi:hypothetical protein
MLCLIVSVDTATTAKILPIGVQLGFLGLLV